MVEAVAEESKGTRFLHWISAGIFVTAGTVIFLQPYVLLAYLLFTAFSAATAFSLVSKPATIDIGWKYWQPIAQFKIRGRHFRLYLIPVGVQVDNADDNRVNLSCGLLLLAFATLLSFFAFWIDGWPQPVYDLVRYNGVQARRDYDKFDPHSRQIKVLAVVPKSLAEKVGLQYGDIITAVNGKTNLSIVEFAQVLLSENTVALTIDRLGSVQHMVLSIPPSGNLRRGRLGLSVGASLRLMEGVCVTGVKLGGSAYKAGVRPDDCIEARSSRQRLTKYTFYYSDLTKLDHLLLKPVQSLHTRLFGRYSALEKELLGSGTLNIEELKSSIIVDNRFYFVQPTAWESFKFAYTNASAWFFRLPPEGVRISIEPYEGIRTSGKYCYWQTVKKILPWLF